MIFLVVFIAILLLLAIAGYLFLRKAGGGSFPWIQFYLKGKEVGFTFSEVNLLRKISVENRMREPTSLFWSIKQLDRCIKGTIINFRARGQEDGPESAAILAKLFDFRRRVEFSQPKYNLGIKSSRDILKRQRLKIALPNLGPFGSLVVDNMRKYLAISYPEGPKLPPGFSWKGQQIGVSFWREGDAGYFYQAKVIDDFTTQKKYPILHITHNDNLTRAQKRKSVRASIQAPAQLFPLRSVDDASEELEHQKGLKAVLMDISEDGAAILIGGRAKVGLPIKFQFTLSEQELVMSGIVKGVNFDQSKNRSLLHVQALPLSDRTKNVIRSYVYDIFGEQSKELEKSQKPGK